MAVLSQWKLIAADLLDIGIDVESGILQQRTGRWLKDAINGLLIGDRRLAAWRRVVEKAQDEEV